MLISSEELHMQNCPNQCVGSLSKRGVGSVQSKLDLFGPAWTVFESVGVWT
jgi:hypothetical protein